MKNEIRILLTGLLLILGVLEVNGQTNWSLFSETENFYYYDGISTYSVSTISPCTTYTAVYSFSVAPTFTITASGTFTVNLPDGITFSAEDGTGTGASVTYISGSPASSPAFNVSWSAGITVYTFSMTVQTPTCSSPSWTSAGQTIINTLPLAYTYTVTSVLTPGTPVLNPYNPISYYFNYDGVSYISSCFDPNIIPGESGEILIPLENDGFGGMEELILSTFSVTAGSIIINGIAVDQNSSEYTGTYTSIGSLPMLIGTTANWGGSLYNIGDAPLYVHIGFTIPANSCPSTPTSTITIQYDFSPGCGVTPSITTCGDFGLTTTNFNYYESSSTFIPIIDATPVMGSALQNADYCGSSTNGYNGIMGFVYSNDGTNNSCAPSPNACAVIGQVIFNVNPNFGYIPGCAAPTFTVAGAGGTFTANGTCLGTYLGYDIYSIDLTGNTSPSEDLGSSSLTSYPGSTGAYNELAPGNTFTVTTAFTYTNTCPYTSQPEGDYNIMYTDVKYNNDLCGLSSTSDAVETYTVSDAVLAAYTYRMWESTAATLVDISPCAPNITPSVYSPCPTPDFSLQVCTGNYQQYWGSSATPNFQFACSNADYQLSLTLPSNYKFSLIHLL